ncbi:MAG: hypothetical protein RL885_26885 [Planctomycetota bacterium]
MIPRCCPRFRLTWRLLIPLAALTSVVVFAAKGSTERDDVLGKGDHRYRWVQGWGELPEGMSMGNTHGAIVSDRSGSIYVNTDADHAVLVYSPDGALQRSFGKEYRGGLHGMTLVEEDGDQYLYVAHTGRHVVAKLTLEGETLWTLGYPHETDIYASEGEYRPTSIAVADNGDLYVADGYGKSWIHHYDKDRRYLSSFGGPGTEPGKMRTPHGIWIDRRGDRPVLGVADRENNRLQFFGLDGELLSVVTGIFRRPCSIQQHEGHLVIADLAGRVTILNEKNELVCHLGDQPDPNLRAQNGVPKDKWLDGIFISPHNAHWDANGDLYVLDWVSAGRVSKLEHIRKDG